MVVAGCATTSAPVKELGAPIDAAIEDAAKAGFTGAVLVRHRDRVLVDRSIGGVGPRFWIASVGKQFTAAAMMVLRDRGVVSLDTSVGEIFVDAPQDRAGLTVRQLLSHTSGLTTHAAESVADSAEARERIWSAPLAESGRFAYANDNYQLAAAIVEKLSGERYEDFVRTALLAPAGLTDTGQIERGLDPNVAPSGGPLPTRLTKRRWGQQGWYSSARDLDAWYRALRAGRVISEDGVEALFRGVAPIREGAAALGWFIGATPSGEVRIFTRGNEDFGPNALVYAYPESKTVIVVLTHAGERGETSHSRALHGAIEALLFGAEGARR